MKIFVSLIILILTFLQYASAETVAVAVNFDGMFVAPLLNGDDNTAVKYAGKVYPVTIVSKDEQSNIAVLKAECDTIPLKTGNSNNIISGSVCRAVIFKPFELKQPPAAVTGKVIGWQDNKAGLMMMKISFIDELPAGTPIVDQYGEIIALALNNRSAVAINDVKLLLKSSKIYLPNQSKSVIYDDAVLPARLSAGIAFIIGKQPLAQTGINLKDSATFITIPAGVFIRGTKRSETTALLADESPQRPVTLDEYEIYRDEVTVKQFQQFCRETNRKMPAAPAWGWQDDMPMVNVTWQDAADYAAWAGGKLPTEAQWEKSSRGTDGRIYPWGNKFDLTKCAALKGNNADNETPVDEYDPIEDESIYGVRHTAGNVMEWCSDWYDAAYYFIGTDKNPTGPENGTKKVLRGGSYRYNNSVSFRCAARYSFDPAYAGAGVGFRCVVSK